MFDEYSDEKWWVRYIERAARRLKRFNKWWHWALICGGVVSGSAALYALFVHTLGFGESLHIDEQALRASSFYGQLGDHVDAYRWLKESERDPLVSEHVIEARRGLNHSEWLVLVDSSTRTEPHSRDITCAELFSVDSGTALALNKMFYETIQFLYDNPALGQPCACAPMFGHHMRYLAVYSGGGSKRHVFDADAVDEEEHSSAHQHSADNIFHALNILDEMETVYDRLDSGALAAQNIELAAVREEQPTRYNEPRGSYIVLRRTKLRLALLDRQCHKKVVRMRDSLAFCTQRCLDMMRGIDVRERARMQFSAGVQLNQHLFKQTLPGTKDEL